MKIIETNSTFRYSLYFLVFTLIQLPLTLNAQEFTFRVMASRGENWVIESGSESKTELKTGSILDLGDEIIIGRKAYVGLMHHTGKTIELREQGTITVAELVARVTDKNTGFKTQRREFILSGILVFSLFVLLITYYYFKRSKRSV